MPPTMSSLTGWPSISTFSRKLVRSSRGLLAVVLDLGEDVVAEVVHALAGAGLLGDALEHVVDELAEQFLVLGGEAEHAADDVDRDVLRVLHGGVDDGLAGGDVADLVEQLLAQPADLRLPRLDLLRARTPAAAGDGPCCGTAGRW